MVVVENAALPSTASLDWVIGDEPSLSIGQEGGPVTNQLFAVRDAAALADGRLAIANAGTGEIRLFRGDGTHAVSMGRIGEGPGEFSSLVTIEPWPGDSILAWDPRQQRVSIFSVEGSLGRTFRVDVSESFQPELLGMTRARQLFFRSGFPQRDDEPYDGMFRPDQRYVLVDGEGRELVDLGTHPGTEGFLLATGGTESFSEHPHAKSTRAAVWADQVVISPNDTYELRVFSQAGELETLIRLDQVSSEPTRADLEDWFETSSADQTNEQRSVFRRSFEMLPLLGSFPAFSEILIDELDHLWVRDYRQLGDDRVTWAVFDPAGSALGRFETPGGLQIFEIGAEYLLGRTEGSFGVESVQMWSLTR